MGLQALYKEYMDRLSRVLSLLNSCVQDVQKVLREERQELNQDILFISKGTIYFVCSHFHVFILALEAANIEYSTKLQKEGTQQKTLLSLAWKLDDLSRLSQDSQALGVEITTKIDALENPSDYVTSNKLFQQAIPVARKIDRVH